MVGVGEEGKYVKKKKKKQINPKSTKTSVQRYRTYKAKNVYYQIFTKALGGSPGRVCIFPMAPVPLVSLLWFQILIGDSSPWAHVSPSLFVPSSLGTVVTSCYCSSLGCLIVLLGFIALSSLV